MNEKNGIGKKWRHGSVSFALTAAVIAAVILVNALVGAILSDRLWFIDETSENMYTLSEEAIALLDKTLTSANEGRDPEDPAVVDIIFCADPDLLRGNEMMRYVYYTALQMEKEFPKQIKVSTVDVWRNSTAVDKYRTNSYSSIYQNNVIVASGTEFRLYTQKSFYTYDTDAAANADPWAYNGEKSFLSGIIAVTRAEAPICALTTNHGEPWTNETERAQYTEFLNVIEKAGYEIVEIDLEKDAIPENCRLIITFDPQTDFVSDFKNESTVSESKKLNAFLDKAYSYMVFVDADTPELPNMEEFLEQWGIAFGRYESTSAAGELITGTYEVFDPANARDDGGLLIGQYETEALGGSLTKDMRTNGAPKVIFGNALSIRYSDSYETTPVIADAEQGTGAFTYGYYFKNEHSREIYDVFRTGDTAYAYAKAHGDRLQDEAGEDLIAATYDAQEPFRLMTITRESRTIGEGKGYTNINDASYVCAVGSTSFASNEVLANPHQSAKNAYGNTDILLAALRQIGREIEPVGLTFKPLYTDEAGTDFYTPAGNTVWMIFLIAVPVLVFTVSGTVILVTRRTRS